MQKLIRAVNTMLWMLALIPLAVSGAYPEKPVRLIVPLPPGGGNDIIARAIGNKLGTALGQQFVVDNQAGAGGAIGAEIAAKAAPDGYTLFFGGVASHGVNPNLRSKPGYDPVKDFAPISLIATVPLVLVVHPTLPVRSVKELVKLAKTKPGELNFASLGVGSSSHLAAELFMMMAGTKMTHIPYIMKIVRTPDMQDQLARGGADPVGSLPEEFTAHIKKELARWAKVIKQSGIHVD